MKKLLILSILLSCNKFELSYSMNSEEHKEIDEETLQNINILAQVIIIKFSDQLNKSKLEFSFQDQLIQTTVLQLYDDIIEKLNSDEILKKLIIYLSSLNKKDLFNEKKIIKFLEKYFEDSFNVIKELEK